MASPQGGGVWEGAWIFRASGFPGSVHGCPMAFPVLRHASPCLFLPVLSFSFLSSVSSLSAFHFPPSFPAISPLSLLSFPLPLPRMGSFPGRAEERADGSLRQGFFALKGRGGGFWRMRLELEIEGLCVFLVYLPEDRFIKYVLKHFSYIPNFSALALG